MERTEGVVQPARQRYLPTSIFFFTYALTLLSLVTRLSNSLNQRVCLCVCGHHPHLYKFVCLHYTTHNRSNAGSGIHVVLAGLGVLQALEAEVPEILKDNGFSTEEHLRLLTKEDADEFGINRREFRQIALSLEPPSSTSPDTSIQASPRPQYQQSVRSPGEFSLAASARPRSQQRVRSPGEFTLSASARPRSSRSVGSPGEQSLSATPRPRYEQSVRSLADHSLSASTTISRTTSTSSTASSCSPSQLSRASSTMSNDSSASQPSPQHYEAGVEESPSERTAREEREYIQMSSILAAQVLAWNKEHGVEEQAMLDVDKRGRGTVYVLCLICDSRTRWDNSLHAWYHFNRHVKGSHSHKKLYNLGGERAPYPEEENPMRRLTLALRESQMENYYTVHKSTDGKTALLVHDKCQTTLRPRGSEKNRIVRATSHHNKCNIETNQKSSSERKRRRVPSNAVERDPSVLKFFGTSPASSTSSAARLDPNDAGLGPALDFGGNQSTPTDERKREKPTREMRKDTAFDFNDKVGGSWVGDTNRESDMAPVDKPVNSGRRSRGERVERLRAAGHLRAARQAGRLTIGQETQPARDTMQLGDRAHAADHGETAAQGDRDSATGSADGDFSDLAFDAYAVNNTSNVDESRKALVAQSANTPPHTDDDQTEDLQGAVDVVHASANDEQGDPASGSDLTLQSNVGRCVLYLAVPYDSHGAVAGMVFVVVGKIRSIVLEDDRWWFDTVDYTATHDQHYPQTISDGEWYAKKTSKENWLDIRESFVVCLFDPPVQGAVKVPRAQARRAMDVLRENLHPDVVDFMRRESTARPKKAVKAVAAARVRGADNSVVVDAAGDGSTSEGSDLAEVMCSQGVPSDDAEEDNQVADEGEGSPVYMDYTTPTGTSATTAPGRTNRRLLLDPDANNNASTTTPETQTNEAPSEATNTEHPRGADSYETSRAPLVATNGGVRTETRPSTTTGTSAASATSRAPLGGPNGGVQTETWPSTTTGAPTASGTSPMGRTATRPSTDRGTFTVSGTTTSAPTTSGTSMHANMAQRMAANAGVRTETGPRTNTGSHMGRTETRPSTISGFTVSGTSKPAGVRTETGPRTITGTSRSQLSVRSPGEYSMSASAKPRSQQSVRSPGAHPLSTSARPLSSQSVRTPGEFFQSASARPRSQQRVQSNYMHARPRPSQSVHGLRTAAETGPRAQRIESSSQRQNNLSTMTTANTTASSIRPLHQQAARGAAATGVVLPQPAANNSTNMGSSTTMTTAVTSTTSTSMSNHLTSLATNAYLSCTATTRTATSDRATREN